MEQSLNILGKAVVYDDSIIYLEVTRLPSDELSQESKSDTSELIKQLDLRELEEEANYQRDELNRPGHFGVLVEQRLILLYRDLTEGKFHYDDRFRDEIIGFVKPEHREGLENTVTLYESILDAVGHSQKLSRLPRELYRESEV
ncbi:hypothetical protein CMI42_04895 [Candidatus Pacearchaeota archaeon]|jgi:hypothetical protein|nr:hypothetical protein [Candidatus Pacearchaeota archaeon]|tara:strand:+ start:812 stop:1243 length:432 start_codon:yes stop_codon:yes gene_type:complete